MAIDVQELGTAIVKDNGQEWEVEQLAYEPRPSLKSSLANLAFKYQHNPLLSSIHIASLPDDRLRLQKAIATKTILESDGYVVSAPSLNEFGYGKDLFAAVDDLRETICELYWALVEDEECISANLRKVLAQMKEHIVVA